MTADSTKNVVAILAGSSHESEFENIRFNSGKCSAVNCDNFSTTAAVDIGGSSFTNIINYIDGSNFEGGIVGTAKKGIIERCINYGSVMVGGIASSCNQGKIMNCYNGGTVSGEYKIGGIVGVLYNNEDSESYISNCVNTGEIQAISSYDVGGIVGQVSNSYSIFINNCKNYGDISVSGCGKPGFMQGIGGIVGCTTDICKLLNNINYGTILFDLKNDLPEDY